MRTWRSWAPSAVDNVHIVIGAVVVLWWSLVLDWRAILHFPFCIMQSRSKKDAKWLLFGVPVWSTGQSTARVGAVSQVDPKRLDESSPSISAKRRALPRCVQRASDDLTVVHIQPRVPAQGSMKARRPSMEPNLDPPFRLPALPRPDRPQHFSMAVQHMQTRKRRRAEQVELDDPSQPELRDPPPKRVRSQAKPNFPPEFWDSLSKVSATHRALRELDRRNNARPAPKPPLPAVHPTDLERFARRGGPDLRHLRGVGRPGRSWCGPG